jgi:hypothetical protein
MSWQVQNIPGILKPSAKQWVLDGTARDGDLDLVRFFVEKGAKDWCWGMHGTASGGHAVHEF